jgi:hypothetical protein
MKNYQDLSFKDFENMDGLNMLQTAEEGKLMDFNR